MLLIALGGPTAGGKTALAIELAREFGADIFSADARQFYRGMDIGTAKPSAEELAAVPHHFVDCLDIEQAYSVGDFEQDALAALAVYDKPLAFLVGGSGLFIRAVTEGLDSFPEVNPSYRQELQTWSLEALQARLAELDPLYYAQVDRQNPQRLIRALEVCLSSGQPYSSFRQQAAKPRPFDSLKYALDWPKAELHQRINIRVDWMREQGLEAEARRLYPYRQLNALQTVGYKELFAFFEGQCSREEAFAQIAQNTRHYAKRQMTWFRKEPRCQLLPPQEAAERIRRDIEAYFQSSKTRL